MPALSVEFGWPITPGKNSSISLPPGHAAIVNPHDFNYIINPSEKCSNTSVFLLIYIHSSPGNVRRRQMLRQTWCDPVILNRFQAKVVFVMGAVGSEKTMNNIRMESEMYGDILQEDYVDSYRNLTYKGISALKWTSHYCENATYILKTDDDIMVHLFKVIDILKSKKHGDTNAIMCNQWTRMKVLRDKNSKWYIPKELFEPEYFPPYCSGSAFILTSDAATKMHSVAKYVPFFWVDDYYITGMLVKKAGVEQKRMNDGYILNGRVVMDRFKSDTENKLLFFHVAKQNQIYKMWKILKQRMNIGKDVFTWKTPTNATISVKS